MSVAYAIARRELTSFFCSPIAYVALSMFLLACGFLFWDDLTPGAPVGMRGVFDGMVVVLVIVIPVLSMGLLSNEWDKGTIETMMTAPVSEAQVVVGKFLGSLGFFAVLLTPTLAYVALLAIFGRPDPGPLVSGYLGMLLVGALFTAIGLFCSSLTRSQVVAAVACFAILATITAVPAFAAARVLLPDFWRGVVRQLVYQRYTDFSRGIIDLSHVIFFVAATAVFLFLTTKVLESRRWK